VLSLEVLLRECQTLIEQGVSVFERLHVSPSCPPLLPSHVEPDGARELAKGASAIGTTGRGIGPAYEDKVARRPLRVADLFKQGRFASRLEEILDFHDFVLTHYFRVANVDFRKTLVQQLALAEKMAPLVTDVASAFNSLRKQDANVMFEGSRGAMFDIDLRTYLYVTSAILGRALRVPEQD
jgi:adenylosuccinate synthase